MSLVVALTARVFAFVVIVALLPAHRHCLLVGVVRVELGVVEAGVALGLVGVGVVGVAPTVTIPLYDLLESSSRREKKAVVAVAVVMAMAVVIEMS